MEGIRTERSFGVTASLSPEDRRALFQLKQHDGWPVLLDVAEMVCIEIETDLINTPAEQEAAILAKHKMSKAAWMVFTHLQERVEAEIAHFTSGVAAKPPSPYVSREERELDNILNPLVYLSDDDIAIGGTQEI